MPKGQSPTVKDSECNIFLFCIDSNCNSIVRHAASNGATMKLKIKVYLCWACTSGPLIT